MRRALSHGLSRAMARQLAFSDGIGGTAFNTLDSASSSGTGIAYPIGTGAGALDALTSAGLGIASDAALEFDYQFGDVDSRMTVTRAGTSTRINPAGLIETVAANTLRIQYDPVTLARLGFLQEESRVNLALWSEDFSNAAYSRVRSGLTANAINGPDGTLSADKLTEQTDTATNRSISQNISVTSGTTYTISVYVKAAERSGVNLRFASGFAAGNVTFDITNLTATPGGSVAASSIAAAGNGWVRCSASYTATSTTTAGAQVFLATTGITYDGVAGHGVHLWGMQVEAGAWATSYIPTTTASVTRAVDAVAVTSLGSWFDPAEGTMYADFTPLNIGTLQTYLYFDDGTANERMGIRSSAGTNAMLCVDGGATQVLSTLGSLTANTAYKSAFAWKANDFAGAQNGGTIVTDATGTLPTVTTLKIGSRLTSSEPANAIYRKVKIYATRRTNGEIVAMTA